MEFVRSHPPAEARNPDSYAMEQAVPSRHSVVTNEPT